MSESFYPRDCEDCGLHIARKKREIPHLEVCQARECYFAAGGIESDIGARDNPEWYWRRAARLWRERAQASASESRGLAFAALRRANVRRCEQAFHPLERWNPLEWAGAMCGEAGEAANAAKKVCRGDKDATLDAIAEEVADVVIYGDLLCARIGADLGEAIRCKFNAVSRKRGSEVEL